MRALEIRRLCASARGGQAFPISYVFAGPNLGQAAIGWVTKGWPVAREAVTLARLMSLLAAAVPAFPPKYTVWRTHDAQAQA